MIRLLWAFVCATVLGALGACNSPGVNGPESLTGYWVVKKAYRDKLETLLLADVFFLFNGDGTMRSNLPHPGNEVSPYTVSGNQIVLEGNSSSNYDIVQHTDSTLVLSFDANNTRFELHLALSELPATFGSPEEEPDTIR
ncbi:MAG: hypothetical protein RJA20_1766 [Bacteroidota bacterium]